MESYWTQSDDVVVLPVEVLAVEVLAVVFFALLSRSIGFPIIGDLKDIPLM